MLATFNKRKAQYRLKNGVIITLTQIRREIAKALEVAAREMRQTGESLEQGDISKAEWNERMKSKIKAALIVAAVVGFGGRKAMAARTWGTDGALVAKQNKYLARLFTGIDNGTVSLSQVARRSAAYANAVHSAYYAAEKDVLSEKYTEVRRVLNSKEGCDECAEYTDWMPIDEMPEIGSLICGSFCRCSVDYR